MKKPVIAVIGTGHMGSSLIGGLIKDGHPPHQLFSADPSEEKLAYLHKTFGIHTTTDNKKAANEANVIIFAVKPQLMMEVTKELSSIIETQHPLLISIAAGVRIQTIEKCLSGNVSIVRAMPNTPALIGCGATALFANNHVNEVEHELAESMMRAVGVVVWLPEEHLLDTVTALSGSGPAYFFLMMESLQAGAERLGLPGETSRLLTLQTALGAARMAIESGETLAELRHRITSPAGTTEKAIAVLEENNIREVYFKTLQAAKNRAEELANLLEKK